MLIKLIYIHLEIFLLNNNNILTANFVRVLWQTVLLFFKSFESFELNCFDLNHRQYCINIDHLKLIKYPLI